MSEVGAGSVKPWKGPKKCELFSLLRRRAGIRNTLVFYSPTQIPQKVRRASKGQGGCAEHVVG